MKLEIYKSAVLTEIAVVMVFFAWKIQSKQIEVHVSGDVGIGNTVWVQGPDQDPIEITID